MNKSFSKYIDFVQELAKTLNPNDRKTLSIDEFEAEAGHHLSPVYLKNDKVMMWKSSRYQKHAIANGLEIIDFSLVNKQIVFQKVGGGKSLPASGSSTAPKKGRKSKVLPPVYSRVPLSKGDALSFFYFSIKSLYDVGIGLGLTGPEIEDYFAESSAVYLHYNPSLHSDLWFIFKLLAYHAQNGPLMKTIQFDPTPGATSNSESHIDRITNGFDPSKELLDFATFRSWHGYASAKPTELHRYYCCLEDIRNVLNRCKTKDDFEKEMGIDSLTDPKDIYKAFTTQIQHCYGEALVFDFLKEYAQAFPNPRYDFPKPDRHIKRIMAWLFNFPNMISSPNAKRPWGHPFENVLNSFDAINLHRDLVEQIRSEYVAAKGAHPSKITNYVLDKALYVLCSGKYYLQGKKNIAARYDYYKAVANKDYSPSRQPATATMIGFLDDFLGRI